MIISRLNFQACPWTVNNSKQQIIAISEYKDNAIYLCQHANILELLKLMFLVFAASYTMKSIKLSLYPEITLTKTNFGEI